MLDDSTGMYNVYNTIGIPQLPTFAGPSVS